VGEVDAGRRLGGARDPDKNDVSLFVVARGLPIVVRKREGHGVDPREILGIELMLSSRQSTRLLTEVIGERHEHRIEDGEAGNLQVGTSLDQLCGKIPVDDGEEHNARMTANARHYLVHLPARADQRPGVLGRLDTLELNEAGPGDTVDRLARRVRYE